MHHGRIAGPRLAIGDPLAGRAGRRASTPPRGARDRGRRRRGALACPAGPAAAGSPASTREVYGRWQSEQGNFAVWAGARIVGVFTLVRKPLAEWPRVSISGPVLWLRALATHPDHRGREIGRRAVRVAQALATREAYLYLDCVSAFLPAYYVALGFEPIARQVIETPDLGPLEVTLMRSATGRRSPSEGHCQVDENSVESPRRYRDLVCA